MNAPASLKKKIMFNIPKEFPPEQRGRRLEQQTGKAARRKGRKASPCPTSRGEAYPRQPVFIILSLECTLLIIQPAQKKRYNFTKRSFISL